jgi:Uma2 family endonuclease
LFSTNKLYTVEEFDEFIQRPENEDRLFELIIGTFVEKALTQERSLITSNIASEFKKYSHQNQIGEVATQTLHRIPADNHNVRQPDISFYVNPVEPINEKGIRNFLPDLVIHIQSPSEKIRRLRERAGYMMVHGAHTVWLIYPAKQLIEVITPDEVEFYLIDDTISGEPLLPGFTMKVRDVFEG